MGLMKAALGSAGGILADQWRELSPFTAMAWVQSLITEPIFHKLHGTAKI